jgi:hypothetical protein
LKPLIERVNQVKAFRSEPFRGSIANQIILDLIDDDIVVADLTDYNPNVFWELGVRHSFKLCTVTIAEKGTSPPFHLSHRGIFFYDPNHLDNSAFEAQFIGGIRDCLAYPNKPDSPVLEGLIGRGSLYSLVHREEINRRLDGLIIEGNENIRILESVIDDLSKTGDCITPPLLTSAIEDLHTMRYLDEAYEFYSKITYLFWQIQRFNRDKRVVLSRVHTANDIDEAKKDFADSLSNLKRYVVNITEIQNKLHNMKWEREESR